MQFLCLLPLSSDLCAIQTRHTDGLDISHIIILEHTAACASKHWAGIKRAVRQSFNGAHLMWPALSQSQRHNTRVRTMHTNRYQVGGEEENWTLMCVCVRVQRTAEDQNVCSYVYLQFEYFSDSSHVCVTTAHISVYVCVPC